MRHPSFTYASECVWSIRLIWKCQLALGLLFNWNWSNTGTNTAASHLNLVVFHVRTHNERFGNGQTRLMGATFIRLFACPYVTVRSFPSRITEGHRVHCMIRMVHSLEQSTLDTIWHTNLVNDCTRCQCGCVCVCVWLANSSIRSTCGNWPLLHW